MIISETAYQSGAGTDRYKRVCRLTRAEKDAVRNGESVFFRSNYRAGGLHGTYWRKVTGGDRHQFYPHVPAEEELEVLREVGKDSWPYAYLTGGDRMKCCICSAEIEAELNGWSEGHNAQPVKAGRCCDLCNDNVVIPSRIRAQFYGRNKP